MNKVTYSAPTDSMPEGEVALRLAFHLFALPGASPEVTVCLDDHHIESRGKTVFAIDEFLAAEGWSLMQQKGKRRWLENLISVNY